MRSESVALIPECVECGDRWLPADDERWQQAWLTCDEPSEVVFYARGVRTVNSVKQSEPDPEELVNKVLRPEARSLERQSGARLDY